MVLTIQGSLSIKVIKKIILWKAGIVNRWIKFLLNEATYTDNCKIFEVPKQINMIKMIVFNIENQLASFKYVDAEFNLILSNDKMIEEVEMELKYKAGMGSDIKFYDIGNRQILKGEYIFEHSVIRLKRMKERAEVLDCKLVEVELNAFIGKLNVRTSVKCFNGWNRRG
jgi:hypothetical protein